jgi:hypothetical protein
VTVDLDHFIVPAHDKAASAKLLGELLGVPFGPARLGPFHAVYLNDGLTLDFIESSESFPVSHFCFRVGPEEFDAILGRIKAAGIKYRSLVRGPVDMKVDTQFGGKGVYWNEPDDHQWEAVTVSYARRA